MKYWTDAEREYMRQHYPNADSQQIATHLGRSVFSVYQHAAIAGLKKSAEFHQAMYALRGEKLKIKGAASRFKAGQRPWNLAQKMQLHPNSQATQFKKGNVPQTHLPVGTIIVDCDGVQKIKVAEPNKWEYLHRHIWEKANGPVPAGLVLAFKDGNSKNTQLSNLELLDRAQLMARNTIHRYPAELKNVIRTHKKLTRKIREQANG